MEGLYLYQFLQDSFNAPLQSLSIFYKYNLPPMTPIGDVTVCIAEDMQNSNMHYYFVEWQIPGILEHESLPLQLLSFINWG